MKRIFFFILYVLILSGSTLLAESKFTVVIDAGHGGKDGGAVRGIYKEKDINLSVALILGGLIEENFEDVKVIYTRKKDVFVDLKKRADIANKAKANLFISIHTNSTVAKTTNVSGADTYILGLTRSAENLEVAKRENSVILLEDDYTTKYQGFDPNAPESYIIFEFMTNKYMEQGLQLAGFIQKDIKDIAKRTDRGVRQAGFLVLRETSMPSILIELGFINNPIDAKFLSSRIGQRSMATAIYSGFKNYKKEFDKRENKPASSKPNTKKAKTEVIVDTEVEVEEVPVIEVTETITPRQAKAPKKSEPVIRKAYTETNKIEQPITIPDKKVTSGNSVPARQQPKPTIKIAKNQIEYRMQFLLSHTILPQDSPLLKGLWPVNYYLDEGIYKYTFGSTANYNEILRVQKEVRTKFKDAFIVKFKNGERVK